MEDRKFTEKESLEVITSMISRTKERYNGATMLFMGCVTAITSVLVWLLLSITQNPVWNWLWMLLPVAGGIIAPSMARKQSQKQGVKPYYDSAIKKIWLGVNLSICFTVLMCVVIQLVTGINCWLAMLIYPLGAIAIAEMAMGILIREIFLVVGGAFGLIIEAVVCVGVAGGFVQGTYGFLPLFIPLAIMMLIPGIILHNKAKQRCKN